MTSRRLLPAFATALLLSGLLTWFLARRLAPRGALAVSTPMTQVVVSTQDRNVGDTLDAASLTLAAWPASAQPAGATDRPRQLAGRVLEYPIAAGQPILERYLAPQGTAAGITASIPAGMRAVAVHADEVEGVAGYVQPNSFVDVLLTIHGSAGEAWSTSTVLADVRVLATGPRPEAQAARLPTTAETLTLLLTPVQAEQLAQASAAGKLLFTLRNGADRSRGTAAQTRIAPGPANRSAATHTPARTAAPTAAPYVIETVSGGRQTSDSFEGKTR